MDFPLIIAYNLKDRKIGCALIQPAMGATLTGGDVSLHFDSIVWETNPSKCLLYTINNEEEFERLKLVTTGKPFNNDTEVQSN